jgi:hypothetical protein
MIFIQWEMARYGHAIPELHDPIQQRKRANHTHILIA